jgi:hypothetical protein
MILTMLALPFMILGLFVKPYAVEGMRCVAISFVSKQPFCFPAESLGPEVIRYGALAIGFALIYAGRWQIRRQRGGN